MPKSASMKSANIGMMRPAEPSRRERTAAPDGPAQLHALIDNLEQVIVGKRETIELAVAALLSGGHLLVRDVPGVGKTVLARAVARSIGGTFKRIQGTSDLLPADITGSMVYDGARQDFRFVPGPIFANVVLADELNRATPRCQAAFLEALDEGQVTVEGTAHPLPKPFFLVATLNPVEHHGTYPLPEGELDRFLAATSLGYPTTAEEVEVVIRQQHVHPLDTLAAILEPADILRWQERVRDVYVDASLVDYAVRLVAATRDHPDVILGASPRASVGLTRAAEAWATLRGRDFVIPDDIKHLAPAVLGHRLITRAAGHVSAVIADVLSQIPVPVLPRGP